mgnify:CR=1 FL=1
METILKFFKNYWHISIFLFGLFPRLVYSLFHYYDGVFERFADDKHYLAFGQAVANQGPFVKDISNLTEPFVGPFLPWILGIEIKLFGPEWLYIFVVNSIVGAIFPLLIYYYFREFFSNTVSFISAIWISLSPMYIHFTPTAGKDLLICYFNLLLVLSFLKLIKNTSTNNIIFFSFSIAGSFFVDERFLIFTPFFILFFLLSGETSLNRKLKTMTISIFIICLIHLPWLIRNFQVYDRFVLVTERADGLIELLVENEDDNVIDRSYNKFYLSPAQIDEVIKGERNRYPSGGMIRPEKIDFIKKGNIPYEFSYFRNCISNFWAFWKPFDFSIEFVEGGYKLNENWSIIHNLSSILFYGILLPFFIFGTFLFRKNKNILIICSFIYYSALLHTFIVPATVSRYRVPIDFLLTLVAFMTIHHLINQKKIKLPLYLSF